MFREVASACALLAFVGFGTAQADHHEKKVTTTTTKTTTTAPHAADHAKAVHEHGAKNCTHKATKHGDHTDYDHDGHKHKADGDHYDECEG